MQLCPLETVPQKRYRRLQLFSTSKLADSCSLGLSEGAGAHLRPWALV